MLQINQFYEIRLCVILGIAWQVRVDVAGRDRLRWRDATGCASSAPTCV